MPTPSTLSECGASRPASGDRPSASAIYRCASSKDGFPVPETATLLELWQASAKRFAASPCLGHRPVVNGVAGAYVWDTYEAVDKKIAALASGMASLGLSAGQKVGVYGGNCPEWMVAMQACNRQAYVCVPLYDSLGENAVEFIIDHSEAVASFCAGSKLPLLAKALALVKGDFKTVIYWGSGDAASLDAIKAKGIAVLSFDEIMEKGKAAPVEPVAPKAEDICTIMYTSGTTGDPKGVLLRHSAVMATVVSLLRYLNDIHLPFGPGDRVLSYLPLAHIFDRSCEEMFLCCGGAIGYWQGDVKYLVDDIAALKPTMFIGVPRVYDRIYGGVLDKINAAGGIKKMLFNYAFNRKLHFIKQGVAPEKASPFFDKLVFNTVKQRLGGCVRVLVSGGAPLAPHVEEFLKVTMCAPVAQGYGLTETCAASCIADPFNSAHVFTVGPPQPNTELRLESVPEMNYDALGEQPAGEVLLRGPGLFSGYYKQEDKTTEVMDADGFFHTGDIGVLNSAGGLKIVDRKKNIFKLSHGEYIAVEKVEGTFKQAAVVEQIWVYGNSFKSTLVAVVVPKKAALTEWAASNGVSGSFEELLNNDQAKQMVLQQLTAAGKSDKLKGFEFVKAVKLESEMFAVENDLLTPTFKLKRPQLQKRYQADIDAMYVALGQ